MEGLLCAGSGLQTPLGICHHLEIRTALIAISRYLEAKFDYGYFIIFLQYGSRILHKKSQVISTKNEGVTAIFPNFDFILNRENQRHAFIFAQNNLKF